MQITATALLAMAGTAYGHTLVHNLFVNGVDQGDGRNSYIRSPPNNSPIKALTDKGLSCNVNGGKVAPKFVSAAAGDSITFEWFHNTRGDDIIDLSHKGPVITYIAPFTEGDGSGAIWSKLAEDGLTNGKFAVETLVANKGKSTFKLPTQLAAGKYLLRQEIIALHEADAAPSANGRGAQFYPACAQLEVTSGGNAVPDQNFDFNTGYKATDPGITFNLYNGQTSYVVPGPAVWVPNGAGAGNGGNPPPPPPASSSAAPSPTKAPGNGNGNAPRPTTTLTTATRKGPGNGNGNGPRPTSQPQKPVPDCPAKPPKARKARRTVQA